MKTKTVKELLNYAKGEQTTKPRILVTFERNETGEVVVNSASIIDKLEQDIICLGCWNGGTPEFWNNYDQAKIIEEVRSNLQRQNNYYLEPKFL
jgi:hypothetical protein